MKHNVNNDSIVHYSSVWYTGRNSENCHAWKVWDDHYRLGMLFYSAKDE